MAGYDDAGRYRVPDSSPDQEGNAPESSKQRAEDARWVCLECGVVRWGGVGIATWHRARATSAASRVSPSLSRETSGVALTPARP